MRRFIPISFLFFLSVVTGCGTAIDQYFTPAGGAPALSEEDVAAYEEAAKNGSLGSTTVDGDGFTEGWYSMGYEDGESPEFCIGAACFCPVGWSSATFESSMLLLESSGIALEGKGTADLTIENDVQIKSNSSSAISLTGSVGVIAPSYSMAGNYTKGNNTTLSGTLTTGVAQSAFYDPLAFLPYPSTTALVDRTGTGTIASGTVTLQPGIYTGGISITGGNVTFAPGLYYLVGGGLSAGSGSHLYGAEVTFFVADAASSTISISSGSLVQFSPPADGHLKGLTLFVNRSNAATINITGGGTLKIFGTIYAPAALVELGGNGTMVAGSQIVARRINLSGNNATEITATTGTGTVARPDGCFSP